MKLHFFSSLMCAIVLFVTMTIVSCHDDESEIGISWSQESRKMIHDGIKTDYGKKKLSLVFYTDDQVGVSASSKDDWIKPILTFSNGKGELNIEVLENKDVT